ncbi:MAG: CoA transferase [Gammaproteobacteria bacterium]|jgi:crotonobetainyl-CoA:carnitine CoA-transferase CaiB-like acyl-CoA transferase|nr:CoA transferase [Gammaproteobacteria bacterium]MBT5203253.1 CoA transferase [Gammaproteobacteria bacterium]
MKQAQRTGPLDDLTIIDCTMAFAGPFGTVLLADLGANVIKVEPPNGDNFRPVPPFPPDYEHARNHADAGVDYGMSFAGVNRNKRSICLDLKKPEDKEILLQLCEQADAIVENMRAGVMDDLGLSYETIAERNPAIVYGAVRGYGDPRTGDSPYSSWPCLDVAGQSAGGLVEATGDLFPVAIADIYPGTLMALGMVSAIHRAQQTGEGEFFDVAMYDSMLALLKPNVAAYSLTKQPRKSGRKILVPFGLFPTVDGRIAIAAPVERHWQLLCEAMGRPELGKDDRTRNNFKRVENQAFTEEVVASWTATQTKQEILDLIGGSVPCGPANSMAEVFADPHVAARNMIEQYQLPGENPEVALSGNPIKFTKSQTGFYQAPPRLGEHSEEILAEFGITPVD